MGEVLTLNVYFAVSCNPREKTSGNRWILWSVLLETDHKIHLWPDVFSLGLHDTAKGRKSLYDG